MGSKQRVGHPGRIQHEGDIVHLVARHLTAFSAELASVGSREIGLPLPRGRGDELHNGSPTPDPRGLPRARDLAAGYRHLDEIRVKTRDFR